MQVRSFHEVYYGLLTELLYRGVTETNARTKTQIKMLQGAFSFKLDLNNGRLPVAGNRRYFPHVSAAEVAWQFMGTRDPSFILKHAPKLWSKFVEYETTHLGTVTAQEPVLKTAYGWRWRKAFGRDQLMLAVKELKENPTNRQLWVQAWDPRSDGLGGPQPKNIPCPLGFSVSRFQDDIHMSVFVRSSDVFVGLPYDVMAYGLTLDAIAATVGCRPASLHFTLAHPHLYEPHWNMARACTGVEWSAGEWREAKEFAGASKEWASDVQPNLPGWDIQAVLDAPDAYVSIVKALSQRTRQNSWNPLPVVVE
jgi:thymidylate synthase